MLGPDRPDPGGLERPAPGSRGDPRVSGSAPGCADPRLALRVPLGDRVRLVDAVGLAHQTPGFIIPVPGLTVAGLDRGLQRSFQTSTGVEADLPLSLKASAARFCSVTSMMTPMARSGWPFSK